MTAAGSMQFLAFSALSSAQYSVQPETPAQSQILGRRCAYTAPFEVENTPAIEKLIQCESQEVNISRPDSDGIF